MPAWHSRPVAATTSSPASGRSARSATCSRRSVCTAQAGNTQGELVKEVVDLSTRYGIVTPYTSFLVQEPQLALEQRRAATRSRRTSRRRRPVPARRADTAAAGGRAPSLAGGARAGESAVQRAEVEKQLQSGAYPAAPAAAPAAGTGANGNATQPRRLSTSARWVTRPSCCRPAPGSTPSSTPRPCRPRRSPSAASATSSS